MTTTAGEGAAGICVIRVEQDLEKVLITVTINTAVGRTLYDEFETICAIVLLNPSTMLDVVEMVVVFPPPSICGIAPMYCSVVGLLRDVSLPFHSATS